MSQPSVEQIGQRAVDLQLLDQRQLSEVFNEIGHRNATPDELVRRVLAGVPATCVRDDVWSADGRQQDEELGAVLKVSG